METKQNKKDVTFDGLIQELDKANDSKKFEINNIVKHEPYIALFAENDGLENYEIIIKNLDKVLNIGGTLLLEIGYDQKDCIVEICKRELNNYSIDCYKDISGNDRVVVIKLLD